MKTIIDYLKYLIVNKGKLAFVIIVNLFIGCAIYIVTTSDFDEYYYKWLIGILTVIIGIFANLHPFVEFESSKVTKK